MIRFSIFPNPAKDIARRIFGVEEKPPPTRNLAIFRGYGPHVLFGAAKGRTELCLEYSTMLGIDIDVDDMDYTA